MAVTHGVTLTEGAAVKLVDLVGEDTVHLDSELKKIALAHRGTDAVNEHEIVDMVSRTAEVKPWEFVDAFAARDVRKCLLYQMCIRDRDAYEVNISCPNVDAGGMTIGTCTSSVEEVVSRCRAATKRPLVVKLTPNVTDVTEIARAAVSAGADALSLINTLMGMAIDAEHRRPELARGVGGLSGPAVKPVALRMVWECHKAVDVPLLGMGGIANATDAVEFMLAGATAVAVGTANFVNPCATVEIIDGMAQYCERHGVKDVNELIGALEW